MKNKNKYIVGGSLSLMLASMTVLLWLPTRGHHDTETPTTDGQQTSQQNAQSPGKHSAPSIPKARSVNFLPTSKN